MRIFKRMIKSLCFFVVFCVVCGIFSFLLEPDGGASDTMWEEYYSEEEIDTIFVGASVCSAGFNPVVFNEEMGVQSFNMATPSQGIEQTILAVKTAISEHKLDRVIFGMGFFNFQTESVEEAKLTFINARNRKMGLEKGVIESVRYIFSEGTIDAESSINFLVPWTYNHVQMSWENIVDNVRAKLTRQEIVFDAESNERRNWRLYKGYRPFTGCFEADGIWRYNSYYIYNQQFYDSSLVYLEELIQVCREQGVELIVINVPHPAYDVITRFDCYEENEQIIRALCEKNGIDYYNFNLAKPEIYDAKNEYYYDFEHLNYKGSCVFTEAVCDLLRKRDAGEEMDGYFYSMEKFLEENSALLEQWKQIREPVW